MYSFSVRVAEGITKGKVDQIKDEIHNERDESHPEKRNVRSRSLPKRFQLTEDMGHRGNQTKAKNEVILFLNIHCKIYLSIPG